MGPIDPVSDPKPEMDDSGYVQDEKSPKTKTAPTPNGDKPTDQSYREAGMTAEAANTANGYTGTAHLLDLSDDVLLCILQYCSPQDLKALGFSCPRLGSIVLDRTLWVNVDGGDVPFERRRVRWLLARALGPHTRRLRLKGFVLPDDSSACCENRSDSPDAGSGGSNEASGTTPPQEERYLCSGPRMFRLMQTCSREPGAPKPPAAEGREGALLTWTHTALRTLTHSCTNLTCLELDYCYIDCHTTNIGMFPKTLIKLSLRGTKCINVEAKSFLFKIQDHLDKLEELDVSSCAWIEPACMLPLSKMAALRALRMRTCPKLAEFVAYASLATRYGFKQLKYLDLRGSPVGDSEVSALGWLPLLEELYISPVPSRGGKEGANPHAAPPTDEGRGLAEWEITEPDYFKAPEISEEEWLLDEDNVRGAGNRTSYYNSDDPSSCILLERMVAEPVAPEEYSQVFNQFVTRHHMDLPLANPNEYRAAYDLFMSRPHHVHPPAGYSLFVRRPDEVAPPEAGPPPEEVVPAKRRRLDEPGPSNDRGTAGTSDRDIAGTSDRKAAGNPDRETARTSDTDTAGTSDRETARISDRETAGTSDRETAGTSDREKARTSDDTAGTSKAGTSDMETAGTSDRETAGTSNDGKTAGTTDDKPELLKIETTKNENPEMSKDNRMLVDDPEEDSEKIDDKIQKKLDNDQKSKDSKKRKDGDGDSNFNGPFKECKKCIIVADPLKNSYFRIDDDNDTKPDSNNGNKRRNNGDDKSKDAKKLKTECGSRANDEKPSTSGQRSDEKPTTSGQSSDEKPNSFGQASDEKPNTSGQASDEKPRTSGQGSDEKPSTSGQGSDEKPSTSGQGSDEKPSTSGQGSDEKPSTSGQASDDTHSRTNQLSIEIVYDYNSLVTKYTASINGNEKATTSAQNSDKKDENKQETKEKDDEKPGTSAQNNDKNGSDEQAKEVDPKNDTDEKKKAKKPRKVYEITINENSATRREAPPNQPNAPRQRLFQFRQYRRPIVIEEYINVYNDNNNGNEDNPRIRLIPDNRRMQFRDRLFNHTTRLDHSALISDASIRRFGRADGENINYIQIGPHGPIPAPYNDPHARPNRSNLRVLSATGFRHITNASLTHLATAAPFLTTLNVSGTSVTAEAVERFRILRPDCEVILDNIDS